MIKKKSAGKFFALIVMLCVLVASSVLSVRADEPVVMEQQETGMLYVRLPDFASGTYLELAEVGGFENGRFYLNERFAPSGVVITGLTEASQAQKAADDLAAYAAEHQLSDAEESFYNDGDASPIIFDRLKAEGTLYLIYQKPDVNLDIIKVSPMLILLPYVNAEGESVTEVDVSVKYERPLPLTGAIILTKVDVRNHNVTLQGAEFRLEVKKYDTLGLLKAGDEGVYEDAEGLYRWETVYNNLVTNDEGKLAVEGLPFGVYRFVETKAPVGFVADNTAVVVTVDQGGTYQLKEHRYIEPDIGYVYTLTVENTPTTDVSIPEESSRPYPTESGDESDSSDVDAPSRTSEPTQSSQPQPSLPSEAAQTGDSASKYIVVGVVVGVSLVVVVLLIVLGKKGKKKDDNK